MFHLKLSSGESKDQWFSIALKQMKCAVMISGQCTGLWMPLDTRKCSPPLNCLFKKESLSPQLLIAEGA